MGDIVPLGRRRVFTLDEARELLPAVRRVTERAVRAVDELVERSERTRTCSEQQDDELAAVIGVWAEQIGRLGCEPKGVWLVDFDNGGGYYCWHYPEADIEHFHSYGSGFSGRAKLL
jgi:hypothetical protein